MKIRLLIIPIIIVFLLLNMHSFYSTILFVLKNYSSYKWFLVGFIAYYILRILFRKNENWLYTHTHEWTHAFVAILFGHKIHSSYAEENSGVMHHSGKFGNLFITLAPYCLPVYTYLFCIMRLLSATKSLWIFDLLIGITLAFHTVCFIKQTRSYQTDIREFGLITSYLFIFSFLMFNAAIILLTVKMGIWNAFIYQLTHFWKDIVYWWNFII